jgi:protein-S-isoprenylcysteine O-methyltransferase Ste14
VVGPVAERRPRQKVVQAVASVAFVALHVVPGLDRRWGWTSVPTAVSLAADLVVLACLGGIFCVFSVNGHASSTVGVTAQQRVVTTGPYAVVRHPMYAAALVMLAATPLALGSLAGLPVVLLMVAAIAARTLDEERLLRSELAGYRAYCQAVRWRLAPGVW